MKQEAKKTRILFIDDSHTEVKYLQLLIEMTQLPLTPVFVHSAIEGLQYIEDTPKEKFPEIIVVDINMPLMNGFEFAEIYSKKYLKKYRSTQLFIYSTSIDSSEINKAKSIDGVVDFIPKPFDESTYQNILLPYLQTAEKIARPG